MQLWADATSFIASPDMDDMAPLELALKIIRQNTKIPVIITDKEDQVISLRNIEGCDSIKSQEWAQEQLRRLIANDARVIDITVDNNEEQHLYYGHTAVIERLKIFPYIQMALVLEIHARTGLAAAASFGNSYSVMAGDLLSQIPSVITDYSD